MTKGEHGFLWRHKAVFVPLFIALGAIIIFQIFYPSNRMLPIEQVDGLNVGGWQVQDVVNKLNDEYNNAKVQIYFGKNAKPHSEVSPNKLGLQIGNANRVNNMHYPWYMRLVPTSFLWYGLVVPSGSPTVRQDQAVLDDYIAGSLGDSCDVSPVNASLYMNSDRLRLVEGLSGGTCKLSDVHDALTHIDFSSSSNIKVRIPMNEIQPDVTDDAARALASTINTKLLQDVVLSVDGGSSVTIPRGTVMSWLDFSVVNGKLTVTISKARSESYYNSEIAPQVTTTAGTTIITTSNLTDVMREQGSDGQVLNIDETNRRITEYLIDQRQSVTIALTTIFPNIEYASRFDPTSAGLSALIQYYAQTHPGSYGVRLIELSGQQRNASYNADQEFNVAGAGRLLMGYTMLNRIEQGLAVARSDNDGVCVQAVLSSFKTDCVSSAVFGNLDADAKTLGLNNTTVVDKQIKSTADDLASLLQRLYDQRLGLKLANNQLLYNTLVSAGPRSGIASSIGIGDLDATGEQGSVLSDAAIVFTANSNYILVILTDGSSWSNVADLTTQIQGLISQ